MIIGLLEFRKSRSETLEGGSQWGGGLRLSAKILALLRPSVNFFQLRLTKKLIINLFCFKGLNINQRIFFVSFKQNKGFRIISG